MAGSSNYRCIEVMLKRRGASATDGQAEVLTVDNHWDTLRFVQENMDHFVGNIVKMKRLQTQSTRHVEESARLFERNLEPFFGLISAISKEHVMDKLSSSLKKALLLMAMERYNCDKESVCRALGLSKGRLERELTRCGLLQPEQEMV